MNLINENLLNAFALVVKQTGGYVSHLGALYFLGQLPALPEELSIVSSSRRPDKAIDGVKIRMVSVRDFDKKRTQLLRTRSGEIRISTLEQTLVDLMNKPVHEPTCLQVAQLFLSLPFEVEQLIDTARQEGDTCLKRALFYLCWTARGGWKDFPGFLNRTPVKLSPGQSDADSCWCNHLFVRFPASVLREFPAGKAPPQLSDTVSDRISLAAYAPFREYFFRKKTLPVFDSPGFEEDFDSFCQELLDQQREFFSELLLNDILKNRQSAPAPVLEWLFKQAAVQKLPEWFMNLAGSKVVALIKTEKFENVVSAVNLTVKLQLYQFILPVLMVVKTQLAKERRYDQIEKLYSELWKRGALRSLDYEFHYLAALVMIEKNSEALEVISSIRHKHEIRSEKVEADLAYYAALIHNNNKNFVAAIDELNICRPYYQQQQDTYSLAGVEIINGAINLEKARFFEARTSFLRAYKLAKELNKAGSIEIETLTNMAQLELSTGHFDRCLEFGRKALKRIALTKGSIREFSLLRTLLPAEVYTGNLAGAFVIVRRLIKVSRLIGSNPTQKMARLFHSWLYELMGQPAVAGKLWEDWDENLILKEYPPYLYQPFIYAKLTRLVMNGKIVEAHDLLLRELQDIDGFRSTGQGIRIRVQRWLLKGLLMAQKDQQRALSDFRQAAKLADEMDDCQDKKLVAIITGSFYPTMVGEQTMVGHLRELLTQRSYDPFWFLYAKALSERGLPEGQEFLHRQCVSTHKFLLAQLELHFPYLRKCMAKNKALWQQRDFLLMKSGKHYRITRKSYQERQPDPRTFYFDSNTGHWSFLDSKGTLKCFSNTYKIFSALLLAKDHELTFSSLFQSVWGWEYASEFDKLSILSALTRAKAVLSRISPSIQLLWNGKGVKSKSSVTLQIKLEWEAVF